MSTKVIYLLDPYNDVIRVTAVGTCEFKLTLNGAIVYDADDVRDRVKAIGKFNPDEDDLTEITRFTNAITSITKELRNDFRAQSPLMGANVYDRNICGETANSIIQLFRKDFGFGSNEIGKIDGGNEYHMHTWNFFNDGESMVGSYDAGNKSMWYKGRYQPATKAELWADKYLYIEPLHPMYPMNYDEITWEALCGPDSDEVPWADSYNVVTLNTAVMKLPNTAYMIFPIKQTTAPKAVDGTNLQVWATCRVVIPAGVTGDVEMPFYISTIQGAGTITMEGENYTLPTDETDIVTLVQTTYIYVETWFRKFTINTNTGGITVDYLINLHTLLLLHRNVIEYEMTTGALTFAREKTTLPVNTYPLSVKMKGNSKWTTNFYQEFTKDKSIKHPVHGSIWDEKGVFFYPDQTGKFSPTQYHHSYVTGTVTEVEAGELTIDTCWSAKLMPRVDDANNSLECSFTAVDTSDTYYTLDGSTPDATKTKYTAPFTITETTTIKWVNIKEGYTNGVINSRTITINPT